MKAAKPTASVKEFSRLPVALVELGGPTSRGGGTLKTYYNEFDSNAAAWIRNLGEAGIVPALAAEFIMAFREAAGI